jgi:alkyl sulfatase BDS1-like metallo-beta-lactamase superfamily hydrolase
VVDVLDLSARIIDSGLDFDPVSRMTQEVSEVADRVALVESFSHSVALRTGAGLVVFDASGQWSGKAVVHALRRWSADPVDTIVYTHGHLDHVGGSCAFVDDAARNGARRPRFVAQENVRARFARYRLTDGWNLIINYRQFAGAVGERLADALRGGHFLPDDVAEPEVTFAERLRLDVGGQVIELHHARGETDDHLWAWLPAQQAICCGDLLIWNFPNAGNPQKVQRYPLEWAAALRAMSSRGPELLIPAHGLPIAGQARIARVLDEVAGALEDLVHAVLDMMNAGSTLDEIIHSVTVPEHILARPYLRPNYDEPEFVIRNIWRLYGGWWDGNPARLKPPPDALLAAEVAALAGGADTLARRARAVGDLRLACQLAEWAVQADPASAEASAVRAELYRERKAGESSLMAKAIFGEAAAQSDKRHNTRTGSAPAPPAES